MIKEQVNVLIKDGGLGDLLCSLVAVDYNIKNCSDVEFLVWVPDHMVDLTKHVLTPGAIIRGYSKAKHKYNDKLAGVTTGWNTSHTPMRTHPVDFGFHMLSDTHIYDLNQKNYLKIKPDEIDISRFDIPEKYVIVPVGAVCSVKAFPIETANAIVDFIISKGYTPVFLGKEKAESGVENIRIEAKLINIDYSKGVNLVNRTNLLESAKLIHNAKAIVGMDGGLIHLAGYTDTNIICGYTLVSPVHVAPIRNGSQTYKFEAVEPDEHIPNRYYQTKTNFNYDEDMRYFKGWEEVVKSMTPEKFIKALEKVL